MTPEPGVAQTGTESNGVAEKMGSVMSTNTTPARRSGSVASKVALVVALVLIVALVIFVLQNTVHTTISFIGWDFDLGVGVALLGAAVVGAVIALIVSAAIRVRRAVK